MPPRETKPDLDDHLTELVARHERPDAALVRSLLAQYPEHHREITDFAAAWAFHETLPTAPLKAAEIDEEIEDTLADWDAVLARSATSEIDTLIGAAKRAGLSPAQLAGSCEVDVPTIVRLDRRMIRPETVPERLVRCLAEAINSTVEALARYLGGSTRIAGAFLAHQKPTAPDLMAFNESIERSSLPDHIKRRWLDAGDDAEGA